VSYGKPQDTTDNSHHGNRDEKKRWRVSQNLKEITVILKVIVSVSWLSYHTSLLFQATIVVRILQ